MLLNYEGLAGLEEFLGDAPAARAAFASGLAAARPPSARFLREAALFEKRAGASDAAAALFRRAARAGPRDYKTWLAWGVLERRRRHWEAAAECFAAGVGVAPSNPHIWWVRRGAVLGAGVLHAHSASRTDARPPFGVSSVTI